MISASFSDKHAVDEAIVSSVIFCTRSDWMRWSSSLMVLSFSAFFRWSMPSRRTWRAATRACSAY